MEVHHKRGILIPLMVVNGGLISETFMLGLHYFVDVIAGVALFGGSVWLYRVLGKRLVYQ